MCETEPRKLQTCWAMLTEFELNEGRPGQLETNILVLKVELGLAGVSHAQVERQVAETEGLAVRKVAMGDIAVGYMEMEGDSVARAVTSKIQALDRTQQVVEEVGETDSKNMMNTMRGLLLRRDGDKPIHPPPRREGK